MELPTNPNALHEPDLPPRKVARATLWLAAAVALITVPLALARTGPDWLEVPIVIAAVLSSLIVVAEIFELVWRRRRLSRFLSNTA